MLRPLHVWTPTIKSEPISKHMGCDVWLKMECYQPTGSYKIRGIGHMCQHYHAQGSRHFVCSSGGNAGVAVAYAGRKLGVPVSVFVPETSKPIFRDAIQMHGAEVIVKGQVWDETDEAAREAADQEHATYIPPFDHPLIWEGHATMMDEVADSGVHPEAVVVAVGGGGMACGVLQGLHAQGWSDVPVIGVETEGAASFAKSLAAGKLITLDRVDTVATSLAAKRVASRLFEWSHDHPVQAITVTDKEAILACRDFANDHRVLVEPSCGATLATLYSRYPKLQNYKSLLVIVCGGVGISLPLLDEYLKYFGIEKPLISSRVPSEAREPQKNSNARRC